jgi:DNA polymerase III delta prime subunit
MNHSNELFINKFQPIYFTDYWNNENIINLLKMLLEMDNLNILLLSSGSFGKTSLINTIVREYYKSASMREIDENVLCINSLKDQGINYYRTELKVFCQTFCSIKNKKKIIVLDDIDNINDQSQQVFRNCIDKYSKNVHFIASTNNIQKVIESIQSRLTMITLPMFKESDLSIMTDKIILSENISIENDAKHFIMEVSNYSIKNLINYMEKIKLLNEHITLDVAKQICTNINYLLFETYSKHILNKQLREAIAIFHNIHDKGYSVMDILDNYFSFIKCTTLFDENQKYIIISYICKYITIFNTIHEDEIELALFTNNILNSL